MASGVGVLTSVSGNIISITGQLVIASGVWIASGIGVVATVSVGSGLYLASGLYVMADIYSGGPIVLVSGFANSTGITFATWSGLVLTSGIWIASGRGVVATISGNPVNVVSGAFNSAGITAAPWSGQYLASGIWFASGIGVITATAPAASGAYLASGLYIASGIGVITTTSPAASGAYLASGLFVNAIVSGTVTTKVSGENVVITSGNVLARISGNAVWISGGQIGALVSGTINVAVLSGQPILPGMFRPTYPAWGSGLMTPLTVDQYGQLIIHGDATNWSGVYTTASVSGNIISMTGQLEVHAISGIVVAKISGESVSYAPCAALMVHASGAAQFGAGSGNPLILDSNSGGKYLWSAAVRGLLVKALAKNSGDIYVGGIYASQRPFSGFGFVLAPGEAFTVDITDPSSVRVFAAHSGWSYVTWIGNV
jgi:hypothetical protein